MLGWEFPPHISGGLGTACFGLTHGLAQHGVEVLFVVPRAQGDEDARFATVVGANQVALTEERELAPKTRVDERIETEWTFVEDELLVPRTSWRETLERDERVRKSFELLAVDSVLTPYMTERDYELRVRDEVEPVERLVRVPERELVRVKRRRAVPSARVVREEIVEAPVEVARRRVLEFSGGYGANLMDEVARYALAVEELARRYEFDVIHSHDWMTVPAGLAAKRASGKPLVAHVHATEHDRSGERPNQSVKDLEQLGLDGADRVVCVSHYTQAQIEEHYRPDRSKLRVVHNALTQKEQKERVRVAKAIEEPIVLFLGRVTFQKGPDYFLEAAARVVKVRPDVKFVMSGSGDMLSKMIERAARLGIARNVHFTGFLEGADVERMYAMADLYVMPSVSEPFGIAPLEALALDTPVIVSRQSGVAEVLRSALKVDYWDVEDIANKILALLRWPALSNELLMEGRDEVRAMRWEIPAGKVRDVYREVAPDAR